MKVKLKNILLLGLFTFVSIKLHRNEINDFPKHIHSWAQSDYYAISLGFIDNNFNFFNPQNFVQNPQFPDYFKTPKDNGITAVDFPIHTYNVALLMKLFNDESPMFFRVYTMFFSIVGMFFLFLLIKELNGSDIKALFGVILLLFSPVYLYYRAGFLPSIPSFSCVIIAYFFYIKYIKRKNYKYFYITITFFTIATLTRTPFAIFLIASFCQELILLIRKKKFNYYIFISYFISFSIILSYFIYNSYLRSKYGSIFLSSPLTPSSWEELKFCFLKSLNNWKWHYLTKWHYLLTAISFILFIIIFLIRKQMSKVHKSLILNFIISLFGTILYSLLMLKQFVAHDYYFIDTFLTIFILYAVIVITYIKFNNFYINILIFITMSYATKNIVTQAIDIQTIRKEIASWDKILLAINNYNNGDKLLTKLNIPKNAKLLVLDSEAPNIPFILLRRYGYSVHYITKDNILNKLDWNYDYIVAQDNSIEYIVNNIFPDLGKHIIRIGGNKAFSVFKRVENFNNNSIDDILQLNNYKPFYSNSIFNDSNWLDDKIINSDSIIKIEKCNDFSLTLDIFNVKNISSDNCIIKVSLDAKINTKDIVNLVVAVSSNEDLFYYQNREIKEGNNSYIFTINPSHKPNNKVSLYIWNPNKKEMFIKDFGVDIF